MPTYSIDYVKSLMDSNGNLKNNKKSKYSSNNIDSMVSSYQSDKKKSGSIPTLSSNVVVGNTVGGTKVPKVQTVQTPKTQTVQTNDYSDQYSKNQKKSENLKTASTVFGNLGSGLSGTVLNAVTGNMPVYSLLSKATGAVANNTDKENQDLSNLSQIQTEEDKQNYLKNASQSDYKLSKYGEEYVKENTDSKGTLLDNIMLHLANASNLANISPTATSVTKQTVGDTYKYQKAKEALDENGDINTTLNGKIGLQGDVNALLGGFGDAFGYDKASDVANSIYSKDNALPSLQLGNVTENSQTQNPIASLGGRLGGEALKYSIGGKIVDEIPVLGKATEKLGSAVASKAGAKAGEVATNLANDTILDLALYTTPETVQNIANGQSAGEVAKNTAKNIGVNTLFNIGGGAISELARGAKNLGKADNVLSETDNALKNVSESATDAVKVSEDTVLNSTKEADVISNAKKAENVISSVDEMKKFTDETGLELNGTKAQNRATVRTYYDEYNKALKELEDAKVPDVNQSSVSETEIPKVSNETYKTNSATRESNYASNTLVNKTDAPDALKQEFIDNPEVYNVLSNKETLEKAENILNSNSFEDSMKEYNTLLAKKDPSSIPLGYELSKQMIDNGDIEGATELVRNMSRELTKSGQFSQAAAITMMKSDPMASMRYMEKQIDSINTYGRKKFGSKWEDLSLTNDEIKQFSNINSGDTEAIQNLYSTISNRMAKSYPSTTWEKIVEATKTSMMLNPRTHIRNTVANAVMVPVRSLSDRVSALGQNVVHLFNNDYKVTQSLTGGSNEQKQIATEIFDNNIKPLLEDSNKWSDVSKNAMNNKQVFNDSKLGTWVKDKTSGLLKASSTSPLNTITGGRIEKIANMFDESATGSVMENLRKFDYYLLGAVEDDPFVKKNFVNRLGSYLNAEGVKSIDDVSEDAIQTAYQEALKATFKDDNWMTKMFSDVKKSTDKFGEVALPFTKTPANLAMRGIDYSPAGIVSSAINFKKGNINANQLVDDISKGLVGTAGIYGGYKLAEAGLIQGALSDDKDQRQFEKQQGKQAFSIKLGDKYYTFDWAQPASIPIIIGSSIYDCTKQDDLDTSSVIIQAITSAGDAWADLSPLSSLQDIFGGSDYSSDSIAENIENEILEFPLRLIPSISSATAKTIDPTMRNTYNQNDVLNTQLNTAMSKIPFLSKTLPASYDTWGNERKRQDSTASAAIANFVNPGTLGYDASTPIDSEINRLFDATQETSVFPNKAEYNVTDAEGNKISLDNKQYSEYQSNMGKKSYELAENMINSDYYNGLDDTNKASELSKVYSIAKSMAQNELYGTKISDTNQEYIDIYKNGGADALTNELQTKYDIKSCGLTDNDNTREIYSNGGLNALQDYATTKNTLKDSGFTMSNKNALSAYESGGEEAVKEYADFTNACDSAGVSTSDKNQDIYNQYGQDGLKMVKSLDGTTSASKMIPTLQKYNMSSSEIGEYLSNYANLSKKAQTIADSGNYSDLYNYYNMKSQADTNGNGSLSRDELIPYLNRTGMSQSDKKYWFGMLSTAKNPY